LNQSPEMLELDIPGLAAESAQTCTSTPLFPDRGETHGGKRGPYIGVNGHTEAKGPHAVKVKGPLKLKGPTAVKRGLKR